MDSNTNSLNWFEIPALDIDRAKAFYETTFDISMHSMEMMGMKMAAFPSEPGNGKASGCLCQSNMHQPSADGAVIYLNANPDMQPVLDRIEAAGGEVIMPKTLIAEGMGYMAFIADTEGNRVGIHSQH
jgi:hypothetical protein